MISIEKLRAVKHLVTHGPSCPDGVASALIIKDALPDVRVSFVAYGTEEHKMLEPEPGTLFCDFTPFSAWPKGDGSFIQAWIDMGCLVLDHHPTQRDVTMRFVEAGLGAYGENDRGECGAWLAYEHVWRPLFKEREILGEKGWSLTTHVLEFAELAGVRDTWKRDDPRWQAACEQAEALMFWGFDELKRLSLADQGALRGLGRHLFEKKLEAARKSIDEACFFETERGTSVRVFQGMSTTSDAAEILEKQEQELKKIRNTLRVSGSFIGPEDEITHIVAGFYYRVDAGKLKLQFSTRSHTGYDVGAFCKARGGGGHKTAAGFTVEQSAELGANPYAVFKNLLEEWETGQ